MYVLPDSFCFCPSGYLVSSRLITRWYQKLCVESMSPLHFSSDTWHMILPTKLSNISFWYPTLPETNIAPENGWLEYDRFLLGPGLFSGAFAVSFGPTSNFQSHFQVFTLYEWDLTATWLQYSYCEGGGWESVVSKQFNFLTNVNWRNLVCIKKLKQKSVQLWKQTSCFLFEMVFSCCKSQCFFL